MPFVLLILISVLKGECVLLMDLKRIDFFL